MTFRLRQAAAQVLARQGVEGLGDELFHMQMDGSAWKELAESLKEAQLEAGESGLGEPAVFTPHPDAPAADDIFGETRA